MSQSTSVAVVSQPSQQVATQPGRSLASKIWGGSSKPAEAPSHGNPLVQTAAAEAADAADTLKRLAPEHIAKAQDTFKRFGNPKVKQVVLERGWGSEPQTIGFVAQLGYHITDLETKLAAANQQIAALKSGRR